MTLDLSSISTAGLTSVRSAESAADTQIQSGDFSTAGMLEMQYKMQDLAIKGTLQSTLLKTVFDLAKGMLQKFP